MSWVVVVTSKDRRGPYVKQVVGPYGHHLTARAAGRRLTVGKDVAYYLKMDDPSTVPTSAELTGRVR